MLRDIFVIREGNVLYRRHFGESLPWEALQPILTSLSSYGIDNIQDIIKKTEISKYRISYIAQVPTKMLFVFLTDVSDSSENISDQLYFAREEFLDLFPESMMESKDPSVFNSFNVTADKIFKELRPKISLVGFSGVGKTTIARLIMEGEIPEKHDPTMTGDISTIKVGNLYYSLWDFAGQEKFSFLWSKFIQDSDAVLIITDSTFQNIGKSKFFINLYRKEVPHANITAIANKQDLPNAMSPEEVSEVLQIPVKGMVAVDPENRGKMIDVITETLGIAKEHSPLLKPLFDRDKEIREAEEALKRGDLKTAEEKFHAIAMHSLKLGDAKVATELLRRARQIKEAIERLNFTDL